MRGSGRRESPFSGSYNPFSVRNTFTLLKRSSTCFLSIGGRSIRGEGDLPSSLGKVSMANLLGATRRVALALGGDARRGRGGALSGATCRATSDDVELCREKIDLSKRQISEELTRQGGGGDGYTITFVGADARVDVECPKDAYLLDAGEAAGLELPSSCRGGICGACVGKVTRGTVDQSDVSARLRRRGEEFFSRVSPRGSD